MESTLSDLVEQARVALAESADTTSLANAKARFLGRSGLCQASRRRRLAES
jgi:hypothetical protein